MKMLNSINKKIKVDEIKGISEYWKKYNDLADILENIEFYEWIKFYWKG